MANGSTDDSTQQPDGYADEVIRVIIADDHALFRQAVGSVLNGEPDLDLVAEANDGEEAVRLAEELVPDVVLMDVRMPKLAGIEAARILKERLPSTKIVMLTVSDDEEDLFEAIKAGASGYLLKEINPDEVAKAIRQIQQGQSLLSPSMASKLLTEFATMTKRAEERPYHPKLTDREMQVLKLVAQGMTNREIGKELHISENTVKNHIRNILEKLHLNSRMEAVIYAVREKLLEIE
jgi:two-component system NarL family response regulator